MAGGLITLAAGAQDATAVPAASTLTVNTRVRSAAGYVGLVSDVLTFPGPSTVGNWIMGNNRVLIGGVPTVGQTAKGQAVVPGTPPVMVSVTAVAVDLRASGS
jgi:hypothetical protein